MAKLKVELCGMTENDTARLIRLAAKAAYALVGIDTDKVIADLKKVPVSLHCWQGDDVIGFDSKEALSGGGTVDCFNDHRIAMALHVAALAGNMDIRLNNIECIDKSFPSFLGRLKK